jgi:hypothetical protein
MKRLLLPLLLVLDVAVGQAQTIPLTWTGELRLRSELDGRDMKNATAPNIYTLSRSRVGLRATPTEHVAVFLQIQDSRYFGEEATTMTNLGSVDLHEAWFEVKDLASGLTVKVGKMEVTVGNGRLIQNNSFTNVGRSLSGFLGTYTFGPHSIQGLLFNTRESGTPPTSATRFGYVRDTGDLLAGGVFTTKAIEGHHIELIALHHRISKKDAANRDSLAVTTFGGFVKGSSGRVTYEGDAAVQIGSLFASSVSAYILGALVTLSTGNTTITAVTGALDLYSGQTISAASFGTFDPRYGAGHKFLGAMDYFTAIPTHTANRGIIDAYGRAEFVWTEALASQLTLHHFQLHRTLSTAVPSRDLGQEVDLVTRWKHSAPFTVEVGIAAFLPGTAMKSLIGGSDPGVWMYLSPQINF